jgi:hypothetical protein
MTEKPKPQRKGPGGLKGAVALLALVITGTALGSCAWAVGQHVGHAIGGGIVR